MKASKVFEDAGYVKSEPDPTMVPARSQDVTHPLMPKVGSIVHFYGRSSEAPQPAIVNVVDVGDDPSVASVHLSVFTNHPGSPVVVYQDVPAVMPGVKHDHEFWWQWPGRN